MDWRFPFNNRRRFIKRRDVRMLRTLPNWKRVTDICIAFSHTCLRFLFTLYVAYKQSRQYVYEQQRTSPAPLQPCTVTAEEKQEIYLRMEALEGTLDSLNMSEGHLAELESRLTHLREETYQRIETLEGSLGGPSRSEERLAVLESQVTHLREEIHRRIEALEGTLNSLSASEERLAKLENLQQALQAPDQSKPALASPEQQKHTLLTARSFAARHGIDWNQMQAWVDTQALTPVLSAEGLSDYLLTVDQQSALIRYWKACKIPYTTCEQCPHYITFGSQP